MSSRNTTLFVNYSKTITTARDIFSLVKSFFNTYDISAQTVESNCTEGATATLGKRSVFAILMKNEIPVVATRCILYHQSLVSNILPVTLKSVMDSMMTLIECERCGGIEPPKIHQKVAPPTQDCSIFS